MIKAIGDRKFIVYNVTNAPWPVSDRDVLVESEATYDKASRTVTIDMKSIESPDVPKVNGLVRMPRLIGKFTLRSVNDKVTHVTYEIDADPGGMLPHWLVRMASKDIPYITLTNLRDRVKVMAANGTYKEAVKLYREMGDNWNCLAERSGTSGPPSAKGQFELDVHKRGEIREVTYSLLA